MRPEPGHGRGSWAARPAPIVRSNADTAAVRASGSTPLVGLCKWGGERSHENDHDQRAEPHSSASPHEPRCVVCKTRKKPHCCYRLPSDRRSKCFHLGNTQDGAERAFLPRRRRTRPHRFLAWRRPNARVTIATARLREANAACGQALDRFACPWTAKPDLSHVVDVWGKRGRPSPTTADQVPLSTRKERVAPPSPGTRPWVRRWVRKLWPPLTVRCNANRVNRPICPPLTASDHPLFA